MTAAVNSARASYISAHTSRHASAADMLAPCSTACTIRSATAAVCLTENRQMALAACPASAADCGRPAPACTAPQRLCRPSRTGSFVSVMTDARAVHRSTVPRPYCSIPCSTSVRGEAARPTAGATSWPSSVRLCQNSDAASSSASK